MFGSLHCLAWGIHFPTRIEQFLWRVSTICIIVAPPIGTLLYHQLTEKSFADSLFPFALLAMVPLGILYLVAHLTLIAVAFTCLRSMPNSVHGGVDWLTYIPHL
ncbi:hypothetical protein BYT27DRAFT_7128645 [Phlegmacium glaucopus]|nr:hypothetical protein BYT27DRAFT_7128645 [Phlegmacium glaucopus]